MGRQLFTVAAFIAILSITIAWTAGALASIFGGFNMPAELNVTFGSMLTLLFAAVGLSNHMSKKRNGE